MGALFSKGTIPLIGIRHCPENTMPLFLGAGTGGITVQTRSISQPHFGFFS